MGCDIHIFVERKNKNGAWEPVLGPNPRIEDYRYYAKMSRERGDELAAARYEKEAQEIENGEYLKNAIAKIEYPKDSEEYEDELQYLQSFYAPQVYKDWIFDGRNYSLFAILADVRNYYGFNPISEPRGIPEDACDLVKKEHEKWGCDAHSASYHTLQQLLDYNWDQTAIHSGWVSESEYLVFKETGRPHSYSGGVGGGGVVHLTNEQMKDLIAGKLEREENKFYYTEVSWSEPYRESVSYFLNKSIPRLQALQYAEQAQVAAGDDLLSQYVSLREQDVSADDIRIVFWFDN
jgi:hypothetical protein